MLRTPCCLHSRSAFELVFLGLVLALSCLSFARAGGRGATYSRRI